ncbi:MAG TPA: tetratricopeptide repeat protein [Ktedonobacteraceae bacterium]|nr:tetratricopeptide repeat protein [Ktedonobacteraceae bacterium]
MKPNNLLRRERELRGWSQARVAEEVGTTAINVGRWERGTSMPYPHFREKLCAIFGKDAEALGLLESDGEPANPVFASAEPRITGPVPVYDPAIPLPPGNARLVGRDDLLTCLKQHLCSEAQPAILALNGLPGVGKSALAINLAYDAEVRACFQDGILWAGLGPQPDVMDLLGRWGVLLGIPATTAGKLGNSETWARAIRTAIGQRQMLLVIDDVWSIEEALAFQVGGPHCAYLVTTRYPHMAVQLATEGALTVPELTEKDGVALLARYADEFVKRAPETAQALVHSVGALPLALTLIGKYLSVQVYSGQPRRLYAAVEHLRDARARLQLSETRALTERHPSILSGTSFSLQSVIAVSEQLLDEQTRSALRSLSIFPAKPSSFSEEAALEVSQTSVDILDKLCDAGLLESNGPSRYMLHQTIADYARSSLTEAVVSERLINYYVRFVEEKRTNHDLLKPEISNILAALESAHTEHYCAKLVRGACALASYLIMRGLYSVAEKPLKRAYEAASAMNDTGSIVNTLLYLGPIELAWGNAARAEELLLEGLEIARKAGYEKQICDLLSNLAKVEEKLGNFPQAEACSREGLELARKLGLQNQVCTLLISLGVISGKRGNHGQAKSHFREALALARQSGHDERITILLLDIGRAECERGNYRRSEVYYREALSRAERFGYTVLRGGILIYLGELTRHQGRFTQSREYLQKSADFLRQIGNHPLLDLALFDLGVLAAAEGDDQQAEAYFQECLDTAQIAGDREILGMLFEGMGSLETRRGNYVQAEVYLRDALRIARDLGQNYVICSALFAWGELYLRLQRLDEAALNFVEMRNTVPYDQRDLQALNLYGLARVAYARQQFAEAYQHGKCSLALFSSLGHYKTAEVAGWLEQIQENKEARSS